MNQDPQQMTIPCMPCHEMPCVQHIGWCHDMRWPHDIRSHVFELLACRRLNKNNLTFVQQRPNQINEMKMIWFPFNCTTNNIAKYILNWVYTTITIQTKLNLTPWNQEKRNNRNAMICPWEWCKCTSWWSRTHIECWKAVQYIQHYANDMYVTTKWKWDACSMSCTIKREL